MTLPAYMYRDPQEVLEAKQNASCTGCKHEMTVEFKTGAYKACELGKIHSEQGGRKCRKFKEQAK